MSTDRKLLEDAAKAAGIVLVFPHDPATYEPVYGVPPRRNDTWENWNPLTDDGDALRLAVKLNIRVGCEGSRVGVDWWAPDGVTMLSDYAVCGTDPYAATRRAIVRAAAAIGAAK
jgi:hypothetical protein